MDIVMNVSVPHMRGDEPMSRMGMTRGLETEWSGGNRGFYTPWIFNLKIARPTIPRRGKGKRK